MSANHENDLSAGRRYKKYQAEYNLAFAADPNPQQRHFDDMAAKDDIQWKRLEVFRGNDKDAFDSHRSTQDAVSKPTQKEQAMWEANQADLWRINREPAYGQHDMTNNKWMDLSLEQRRSDSTQNYFNSVEQRHGAGYEAWAAKAGSQVVAKEDYLQTMATLNIEALQAKRAQKQEQEQTQSVQQSAQPQPVQTANAPVQPAEAATPRAVEPAKRTRVSLLDFQGPTKGFTEETKQQLSSETDEGLKHVSSINAAEFQAMGKGRVEDAGPRYQALNALHASEEQQRIKRQQEVPSQTFNQRHTRQQ